MCLLADLRNMDLTLTEILKKHNLTLKQLYKICLHEYNYNTCFKYISTNHNNYQIQKTINDETCYFGTYETLSEAINVRDKLEAADWDKDKVYLNIRPITEYTLWNNKKAVFHKTSIPEFKKAFKVRYNSFYVPIGLFRDFLTCEIIHDLIEEYIR